MKLTKEQAEKLQTLKTEDEIRAFFDNEAVQLDPNSLEDVSGGGWGDFLNRKRTCEVCGTEYNYVLNMKCPNCGAPNPMYEGIFDSQGS